MEVKTELAASLTVWESNQISHALQTPKTKPNATSAEMQNVKLVSSVMTELKIPPAVFLSVMAIFQPGSVRMAL